MDGIHQKGKMKMKKKRKMVIPIIIGILVIALVAGGAIFVVTKNKSKSKSKSVIYVESVANITGYGYTSAQRYMGTVESQEIKGVDKDSDKTVKELFVEEGDIVKAGDKLFSYDTDEMTLKLRQMELELQSIYNGISTMNEQIAQLVAEREQAGPDDKLQYTAQIQNLQAQINQSNYDAQEKQLEIDRQKTATENSVVYSPIDGTITKINNQTQSGDDYSNNYDYYSENNENHYISIMAKGDYRIKATANEATIRTICEGDRVIIKSRLDESCTWTGQVSSVDTEHTVTNDDNYYGGSETASKYPFYVDVDDVNGLIMGQHVYIEYDYGQTTQKEGIWLNDYYIIHEEDASYVWAANEKDEIEKRVVELGEYDENLMTYNIVSGLSEDDYIAYPDPRIEEGMKVTHNISEAVMEEDEEYTDDVDGVEGEEEYYDEETYDEETYDEETYDELNVDPSEFPEEDDIKDSGDGIDDNTEAESEETEENIEENTEESGEPVGTNDYANPLDKEVA